MPIVFRCKEYCVASSNARRARPSAPAATGGRVLSKTNIATLKPSPSLPRTLAAGTRISSNVIPRVSEAR